MANLVSTLNARLKLDQYPIGIGRVMVWMLAAGGIAVAVIRELNGLGVVSNMADRRGWGIWISYDLLMGIAMAAGAFTLAAAIHIFNLKQFRPLLRPAILTGFLGYLLAIMTLLVDLGIPYHIFNLIVFWNIHSPLFEIGWCVMVYSTVLALEFSPVVFETWGWKIPLKIVRSITIPLVILGTMLSTLHQSSLGTLLTILEPKTDPLWYSHFTPIYFFLTAVAGGVSMLVVEAFVSAKVYRYRFEGKLVGSFVKIVPWVLGIYLTLRMIDMAVNGKFQFLGQNWGATLLFTLEILGGVVTPIVLFSKKSVRENPYKLLWSAVLVLVGLGLYRFNISLNFLNGAPYVPSWTEILVSVGLTCVGLTLYDLAARLFPLFPETE